MDEEKYGIVARKKRLLSAYLSRVEGRAVGFWDDAARLERF
jgi:hypothetical protein